jgi:hypothetical protein
MTFREYRSDRHPDDLLANNIESMIAVLEQMAGICSYRNPRPAVDTIVVDRYSVRRIKRKAREP